MAALLWLIRMACGQHGVGADERWVLRSMLLPSLLTLLVSQVDVLAVPLLLLAELGLPKFSVGLPSFAEGVYSLALTDHFKRQLSRHEPSRLQFRGALHMLLGAVLSVVSLVVILGGFGGTHAGVIAGNGDDLAGAKHRHGAEHFGAQRQHPPRMWVGAPSRSWFALLALTASRLVRAHGSLAYNRSRGDTKSAAISTAIGKIRKESNQALSTLLASLRYVANAAVSPVVGIMAHRFGAVAALATAVPAALLLVLVLAPRRWHVEMDSVAGRPPPTVAVAVCGPADGAAAAGSDADRAKEATRGYRAVWGDPAVRSMLLWQAAFLVVIIYVRQAYETLLPLAGLELRARPETIGYALSLTFWVAFAVSLLKPSMPREWRGIPACLLLALGHAMMGWDGLGLRRLNMSTTALLAVIGLLFGLADGISAGIKGEIKTDAQNRVEAHFRAPPHGRGDAEAREIKRAYASMYSNWEKLTIPTRMVVAGIADATSVSASALVFAGLALLDAAALRIGGLGDSQLGAMLRCPADDDLGPRVGEAGERQPLLSQRGSVRLAGVGLEIQDRRE